ncbi:MAG: lipoprotein signal peptidase [Planctomycetaceae bacterium]|nr:MAG: lipoprotein signal peptidase [Planctomycetaceae bacterium]
MRTEARTAPSVVIPFQRYLVYLGIGLGGAALDLWSKWAVFQQLGPYQRAPWEWQWGTLVRFTLLTSFNQGALWGFGQGWALLFAALSVLAIGVIVYFLFIAGYAMRWWLTIALGFITAGALGNLYDRLGLHGWKTAEGRPLYAVRDFLYFRLFDTFDWAIFNLADVQLVTGTIMLALFTLVFPQQDTAAPQSLPPKDSAATIAPIDAT